MKTIATALRILELFADGPWQRSVSEIAEHCELPRS
ncbi:helix-turn-helix domain-containing protein [uncultured Paraburkholderia sp.]